MPSLRTAISLSAFILVLVCLAFPGTTEAHAALERSDPTAGAVLTEPPREIRLWFAEPLEETYTGAELLESTGAVVPGVNVAIAPDDDRALVLNPPALANGLYTVAWHTLSAADGHTLQGYFGFRVGEGAVGGVAPLAPAAGSQEAARALTRGLALLGLAALLAIAPVTLAVLWPAARQSPALADALWPILRRYSVVGAVFALLANVAALAAQAVAVAPDASLPVAVTQTLGMTRYGQLWLVRLLLVILCIVAAAMALWGREGARRPALVTGSALAVVMPLPFSLLSHAAAQTEGHTTAVIADTLHLMAATIWGGGLLLLAAALIPTLRKANADERRTTLHVVIPRFSIVGLAGWGVLALTGLYASWLQVGTVAALQETSYGRTLLLKSALLLPILALAVYHLMLGWRGGTPLGRRRVALTVGGEALLVAVVLFVVGWLIGQEPAREVMASRAPTQLEIPLAFETDDGQRAGRLIMSPGRPGNNTFTLEVDGEPLPDGTEGVLRFALPSAEMGAQELRLPMESPNRLSAAGSEIALPGDWRIEVIVRRIGAFSWATETTVAIAIIPPQAISPNPAPLFRTVGGAGLIALAIGMAALAAAAVSRGMIGARRVGSAAAGAALVVVGALTLYASQIPIPVSAPPVTAQGLPATPAGRTVGLPATAVAHDHAMSPPSTSTPRALPAAGTPAIGDGLAVTIDARPEGAGPVDVLVEVVASDGVPLADARVAVIGEAAEMDMGRTEMPAHETEPGRYVADEIPLDMAGKWRLTVRVSPKGESTQIFSFLVSVP